MVHHTKGLLGPNLDLLFDTTLSRWRLTWLKSWGRGRWCKILRNCCLGQKPGFRIIFPITGHNATAGISSIVILTGITGRNTMYSFISSFESSCLVAHWTSHSVSSLMSSGVNTHSWVVLVDSGAVKSSCSGT